MSFPKYPEYKDRGVEWLGAVPNHWNVKRLRFVVQLNPSKGEVASLEPSTEVSFLPMEAIGENGSLDLERTRVFEEVGSGYTYFREGDVTIAKITPCFENGKGAIMRGLLGGIGFGTTELIVARPNIDQTCSDYIYWLFTSVPFRCLGEAAMYGAGGQKRVPDDFVRNFRIALPCTQEQSAIAAFLDRETAKIDALVAEQEKLIELLKEKRQAVISHAVTKGLDPNVPMKDSGVEWLGKVPEHWEVKKGIQMGSFFGSFVLGDDAITEEGEIPYIKVGSLPAEDFKISTFDWFVSALDVERYEGFSGYVVFPKRGAAIYGNKVAIVNVLSFIDPNLMGWKPHSNVDLRFLAYTLKARRIDELADVSTVPQINVKHIAPEKFPLPPIEEQIKIADYLETQNLMLGNMIAESQRAIDLLKERRSALISAAVTGKIDVRGLTDATQ